MKRIYSFLISIFICGAVSAQCTVFATQYIWPDTNNLSQCFQLGDTLVIDAYSNQVSTPLNNSFEIGSLGAGWAAGASANVIINNPAHCAWPPPANPVPNTAYVWMGNLAAHPRNLTSVDFDLSSCSNLEFDMKYAIQSQAGPCEGPDLYCEGVRIQYSTDAGLTWFNWDGSLEQPWSPPGSGLPDALTGVCATHPVYNYNGIGYWDPDTNNVGGSAASPYVNWFHVNIALPAAAQTAQTRIRWIQLSSSSLSFDHWGLDNVYIGCQTFSPGSYTWTGGAAVDTIGVSLPYGGQHLLELNTLGTYEYVVTFVDSTYYTPLNPQIDICHDTLRFIGISDFEYHVSDVSCYGDSNGIISVEQIDASTSIYSYSINGVLNTNSQPYDTVFTDLPRGVYDITISDNGNCEITDSVTIDGPDFPLQLTSYYGVVSCYGAPTGTAYAMSIGGTPSYSYEWFDGSNYSIGIGDNIDSLLSGSYFIKVTDANGCHEVGTIQILQSQTPLVAQNQQFPVVCKGDNSGMIVSQATGSQGPYKYYWFDSAGDSILTSSTGLLKTGRDTLSGLFTGTYYLHLYDANGCSESYNIFVGEPATALSIDSILVSDSIACYGDNDGAAQTYISGGMPNYYFAWDNGELTSHAVNLTSGYHVVTLTDDWGCVVTDSVFVSENSEIKTTILVDNEVSCYGLSDGSVSASSFGGVPNYHYFWSNGHQDMGTTTTNSGLSYGSYYLTTQDILGCNVVDSIVVEHPDPLYVEATEIDRISCYGYNDGLAYAYGWGGIEPYTFYWDSLTGYAGDTNNMLTSGVHTVYVVDSRGCESTDTVFTHEPPVFEVNIIDSLTIFPYCIGVNSASLTSLANGGTPPYWYEWDDNLVTPQTTPVATNLLSGVYTITVTDYRGCVVSDTRDIDTVTDQMTSTIYAPLMYNGYHVSCYGENDGMLYVEGGGIDHTPFTYQWYGPNGFSSTNDTITNLIAGIYSVTVLDSNNCSVNNSFNITTPLDFKYTITGVLRNESCEGACNGQLSIHLVGGTPPYVGTSTDQSSGTVISSTMVGDSVLGDMCSGVWDVVLTDANGCNSSLILGGIGQETLNYNNSTSLQDPSSTVQDVLCYGTNTGSLDVLSPNPNTTNYAYNWINALTGLSVGTGTTISGIPSGTYVLEAQYMDGLNFGLPYDGCTTRDTIEITEIDQIVIQSVIRDVDCYDNNTGRISVNPNFGGGITGGTPSYTLQWNPTGTGSGQTVNNLTEGTYSLSVTDANGCLKVDTFVVTEPDVLVSNVTQNGATLTVNVTGGTTNYSYSWRETLNPNQHLQGGTDYIVLVAGTYYCIVTDANSCEATSNSFTYTSDNPTSIAESEISLRIYPNPFREQTTIDFGRVIIDGDLKVIDILGNVVDVYELKNQRELVIEKGTKSKGVYFVEVKINNDKIFKKITLQ